MIAILTAHSANLANQINAEINLGQSFKLWRGNGLRLATCNSAAKNLGNVSGPGSGLGNRARCIRANLEWRDTAAVS